MKNVIKTFITACVFALGVTFMWSAGPRAVVGHCGASCDDAGDCPGGQFECAKIHCHNGAKINCQRAPM